MTHLESDEVSDDPSAHAGDRPSRGPGDRPSQEPLWRDQAERLATEARLWVVTHPFAALVAALAMGFTLGRIVRRWT